MLHHPRLVDDHGDPADHRRDEEPRHDALLRPEVEESLVAAGVMGGATSHSPSPVEEIPSLDLTRSILLKM